MIISGIVRNCNHIILLEGRSIRFEYYLDISGPYIEILRAHIFFPVDGDIRGEPLKVGGEEVIITVDSRLKRRTQ